MKPSQSRQLAALLLAQGWAERPMQSALWAAWPKAPADLLPRVMARWTQPYPPATRTLAALLLEAAPAARPGPVLDPVTAPPPETGPLPPFRNLGLPDLPSPDALAAWLEIPRHHLDWFTDPQGRLARPEAARFGHYTETWLRKPSGGLRLVEAPRPRLKALQRRILRGILDLVPVHPSAHGFVAGRNCVQAAAKHAGEEVVLSCDLADFFPSVAARRVHGLFRCLGYPPAVARLLTGLSTRHTPSDVLAALPPEESRTYRLPHLPQGAPTSPALANLAAWRLDVRLAGLARHVGATYTRYADDLTLSGPRGITFEGGAPLIELITEIARDCGFRLNPAKTRIARQGRQQRVTGIVVNRHTNLPRDAFDRLKAILTNCARHGPASQNRAGHPAFRDHLEGRIGWAEQLNPHRGAKLRALFDRIDWT